MIMSGGNNNTVKHPVGHMNCAQRKEEDYVETR